MFVPTGAAGFILARTASLVYDVVQANVNTAFLNSDLDETIFMEHPEGHVDSTGHIWLLQKAIYGIGAGTGSPEVEQARSRSSVHPRLRAHVC